LPKRSILGHVATGLSHQPNRSRIDSLALARAQKSTVCGLQSHLLKGPLSHPHPRTGHSNFHGMSWIDFHHYVKLQWRQDTTMRRFRWFALTLGGAAAAFTACGGDDIPYSVFDWEGGPNPNNGDSTVTDTGSGPCTGPFCAFDGGDSSSGSCTNLCLKQ